MHKRLSLIVAAAVLFSASLVARADTFTYNLVGGSGIFTGSGTITTSPTGTPGADLITAITGTGVTGLIAPGNYDGNDNLFLPASASLLDSLGFAFTAMNGPDTFSVNLHSVGGNYFATFTDEDNFTGTVPVQFSSAAVTPEPSTFLLLGTGLLGLAFLMRKKIHQTLQQWGTGTGLTATA